MRIPRAILNTKIGFRLSLLVAVLCLLGTMTFLSGATATTTSITVVNNSGWEIRHVYLSPANNDNWGPDQLGEGGVIASGQSFTLSVTWDQPTVKVITEDQNGCFLSSTVSATGNAVLTITNDATPDCGN